MTEHDLHARLAGIERSIEDMNHNVQALFELVGDRLNRHEVETDRRFRGAEDAYAAHGAGYSWSTGAD